MLVGRCCHLVRSVMIKKCGLKISAPAANIKMIMPQNVGINTPIIKVLVVLLKKKKKLNSHFKSIEIFFSSIWKQKKIFYSNLMVIVVKWLRSWSLLSLGGGNTLVAMGISRHQQRDKKSDFCFQDPWLKNKMAALPHALKLQLSFCFAQNPPLKRFKPVDSNINPPGSLLPVYYLTQHHLKQLSFQPSHGAFSRWLYTPRCSNFSFP